MLEPEFSNQNIGLDNFFYLSYGYTEILENRRVSRIYLSELGQPTTQPLGLATLQLVVSDQNQAMSQAKILLDRVQQE